MDNSHQAIDPLGFRVFKGLTNHMKVAHTHVDIEINFVEKGMMCYLIAGRIVEIPANVFAVFWGGIPHQVIATAPETLTYWITLPLSTFMKWQLPADMQDRVLRGELIMDKYHHPDAANHDRYLLENWLADYSGGQAEAGRALTLELEARIRRLSINNDRNESTQVDHLRLDSQVQRFQKITHYLAFNYQKQLNAADVAAAVGMHPKYLHRFFKGISGLGLWEYLLQLSASSRFI